MSLLCLPLRSRSPHNAQHITSIYGTTVLHNVVAELAVAFVNRRTWGLQAPNLLGLELKLKIDASPDSKSFNKVKRFSARNVLCQQLTRRPICCTYVHRVVKAYTRVKAGNKMYNCLA